MKTAVAIRSGCIPLLFFGLFLAGCSEGTTQKNGSPQASSSTAARKGPDENAALDAVRKINESQSIFFKMHRRYAQTYDELVEARLLKSEPSAADTGYEFKLRPAPDAQTYKVSVAPADSTAPARHFFTDNTGVIREASGSEASAESPEVR